MMELYPADRRATSPVKVKTGHLVEMLREAQVVGVCDDWDRLESPFVGKRSNQPMVKPCKTHNAESLVDARSCTCYSLDRR